MITINLVGYNKDKSWAIETNGNELMKMNGDEFCVKLTDNPRIDVADITYWLHVSLFKQRISNTKNIAWFYNPKGTWQNAIDSLDHCIFSAKRYYDQYEIPNRTLITTPVDTDLFKPRKIRIGLSACLTPRKDIDKLYEALDLINPDNYELIISGFRWGNALDVFAEQIKCTYIGKLDYKDMPKFYHNIDYFLITSKDEGGPLTLMEALACGVPVISTDTGNVGEVNVITYNTAEQLAGVLDS